MFAGKEVARALAKMTLDPKDCCAKLNDLSPEQLKVLEDWEVKLKAKYPTVGTVRLQRMDACKGAASCWCSAVSGVGLSGSRLWSL